MSLRNDISPETLGIELTEGGVVVHYTDGREVFYNGIPAKVEGTVKTAPAKDVHILVTDPTESEGVIVYVNDRNTADEILESTGVGRVLLEENEETSIFPGVTIRDAGGFRIEVEADPETVRGRVFVFEEDDMGERSFEIVSPPADH